MKQPELSQWSPKHEKTPSCCSETTALLTSGIIIQDGRRRQSEKLSLSPEYQKYNLLNIFGTREYKFGGILMIFIFLLNKIFTPNHQNTTGIMFPDPKNI